MKYFKLISYNILLFLGTLWFAFFFIQLAPQTSETVSSNSISFISYLWQLITGNWGTSLLNGMSVTQLIFNSLPLTLMLSSFSLLLTLCLSALIALSLTLYQKKFPAWTRQAVWLSSTLLSSIPIFLGAYLVILISIKVFNFFPLMMNVSDPTSHSQWLFLFPLLTLSFANGELADMTNYFVQSLEHENNQGYMQLARMKKVSLLKHISPLGIHIPFVTLFASKLPTYISQAVIIEAIFTFNGAGLLAWRSAQQRDYPVLLGLIVCYIILIRLLNALKIFLYHKIHPRWSKGRI